MHWYQYSNHHCSVIALQRALIEELKQCTTDTILQQAFSKNLSVIPGGFSLIANQDESIYTVHFSCGQDLKTRYVIINNLPDGTLGVYQRGTVLNEEFVKTLAKHFIDYHILCMNYRWKVDQLLKSSGTSDVASELASLRKEFGWL